MKKIISILILAVTIQVFGTSADIIYVGKNGSDTRGNGTVLSPFLTLTKAKQIAVAGQLLAAWPGIFSETNLLKNGVDYEFHNTVLYHTNQLSTGLALGIFDDRNQGVMTNVMKGIKRIEYIATTLLASGAISQTNPNNLTAIGPVVITNTSSHLELQGDEIRATAFGGDNLAAGITVKNCAYSSFNFDRITDPYFATSHLAGLDEFDGEVSENSGLSGIYWEQGELHAHVKLIQVPGYGFYANAVNGTIKPVNAWVDSDLIHGRAAAIYCVGDSVDYRIWVTAKEIRSDIGTGAIVLFGTMRFYIVGCGKISITNATSPVISLQSAGAPQAWIEAEKIESGGGAWCELASPTTGRLEITAQQYVDRLNTMTVGFRTTTGTNIIHGGNAKVGNGKGIVHVGGKTFADGLVLDTATTTNSANNPVFAAGAGIVLKDCALIAPAGAQCISATNAQTVTVLGTVTCNTTNSPNITFIGGGTVVTNAAISRL